MILSCRHDCVKEVTVPFCMHGYLRAYTCIHVTVAKWRFRLPDDLPDICRIIPALIPLTHSLFLQLASYNTYDTQRVVKI